MRERIFKILHDNLGEYVSGQKISSQLGITRSAVYKHIKALKAQGHKIISKSRKGHMLLDSPDILSDFQLKCRLDTIFIGNSIFVYDSIHSTNRLAKELAEEGSVEGTVVIADSQTDGKGRMGRHWISPPAGGLWMSIILRPDIKPNNVACLTLVIGLAICKALRKLTHLDIGLKWPNDLVINGRKVCGILMELSAEVDRVNYIIAGIGLNVNFKSRHFPGELRSTATSLYIESGQRYGRKEVALQMLYSIEQHYIGFLQTKSLGKMKEEYKKLSIVLGKDVVITTPEKNLYGRVVDFYDDGSILLVDDGNEQHKILTGDVSLRLY
ncbi:MAG TPA: biotin--[acetyl-CoA-carboxylase] ligase [Clostridiales bacterium]|nr:biotin--[acetyl-CoA-carboxylase] ligase [Clostridiales bacterium]